MSTPKPTGPPDAERSLPCLARRRSVVLAPLAALLPGVACATDQARATRPVFGDMVGLGVKFSQGQPTRDLEMLLDLRVRWVRDVVMWPAVEPSTGRFVDFSPAFLRQLEFYRRHDIGLVAMLTLGNSHAYPGDAAQRHNPQGFGRFAAQVARMLRAFGLRFVLEIGNEPHNSEMAKSLGGSWNGRPPSPWLLHYVRMVHEAVTQVKAVDPTVKLLSDEDMWVLHYRFMEAGLPPALDGFAIHPYTPGVPERTAVAHDTDWTRPFTVVDPDRSFGSAVRRLREHGRSKLGRTPEIWITEWGWAVGGREQPRAVSDEDLVAYLPRAFILAAAAGVEVLCWFSANDAVDGPMGLTRNNGTRRDSYDAFKTLTAQLGDHRLLRQVAGANTPTTGLQAFVFEGPHARKLVAWSADGRVRQLGWPRALAWVDARGRASPPSTMPPHTIAVGAAPVYVSIDGSDAQLDASLAAAA